MWDELKELFAAWIAGVAAAVEWLATRIVPRRRIVIVEGDPGSFTARVTSAGKGRALPEKSFRLTHGMADPAFSDAWRAALRGSHIDLFMRSDKVLFRAVDFP